MSELILLFVLHFVADFLLQTREMGQKKSSEFQWLAKHIAIIFIVFAVGTFDLEFAFYNAIIHMVIDAAIWNGYKLLKFCQWYSFGRGIEFNKEITKVRAKDFKYWEDHWFYATIGLDQLLHGLTLIVLWGVL